MNDILQWVVVAIVLIAVVIYIVRRLRRKGGNSCSCCEMNGICHRSECDQQTDERDRHNKTRQL